MIKEETFTAGWLEQFRRKPQYRRINPPIFEKMTYALLLLEKLAQSGIGFIFKGGTSLILLMERTDRFSVDIDIMTESPQEQIGGALDFVVANSPFIRWEENLRENCSGIIRK